MRSVSIKRRYSTHQNVKDNSSRPDIAPFIIFAFQYFGGSVVGLSYEKFTVPTIRLPSLAKIYFTISLLHWKDKSKSINFSFGIVDRSIGSSTRKFSGFRSRCAIFFSWQYRTADIICMKISLASCSETTPFWSR